MHRSRTCFIAPTLALSLLVITGCGDDAGGDSATTTVGGGTVDEPGRYVAMCVIPTGADPQAYLDALDANPGQPPAVDGGPPHFTAGMYREVTVR